MNCKSGIENDSYNSSLQQFLPIVQISICPQQDHQTFLIDELEDWQVRSGFCLLMPKVRSA